MKIRDSTLSCVYKIKFNTSLSKDCLQCFLCTRETKDQKWHGLMVCLLLVLSIFNSLLPLYDEANLVMSVASFSGSSGALTWRETGTTPFFQKRVRVHVEAAPPISTTSWLGYILVFCLSAKLQTVYQSFIATRLIIVVISQHSVILCLWISVSSSHIQRNIRIAWKEWICCYWE